VVCNISYFHDFGSTWVTTRIQDPDVVHFDVFKSQKYPGLSAKPLTQDILALRTQLGDAEEGAVCSFNIVQDARGVKAANVKVHPEGFPPGMEPQPRPKGKGKGKFGKDDGKGFSKFGKGFNKGKFEEFYSMAQNMLQDWGWYSGGGDGWWGGEGGWDDGSWWEGDATGKGKGEGARFTPY